MFDRKLYMEEYNKQYRINNAEEIKEYNKQYRIINRDRIAKQKNEYMKQYSIDNKERIAKYMKEYYKSRPDYIYINRREYGKKYYKENSIKLCAVGKQWRKDNPERSKEQVNNHRKERWRTDERYRLNSMMASSMNGSLKGNKDGHHWEDLIGYTLDDLIKKLKSTIPDGYTWQDFIEGKLHIDHIIPISVFNYTDYKHTDFKRCWALSNLRLLPARENMMKHNKLFNPFQPALKLSIAEVI